MDSVPINKNKINTSYRHGTQLGTTGKLNSDNLIVKLEGALFVVKNINNYNVRARDSIKPFFMDAMAALFNDELCRGYIGEIAGRIPKYWQNDLKSRIAETADTPEKKALLKLVGLPPAEWRAQMPMNGGIAGEALDSEQYKKKAKKLETA